MKPYVQLLAIALVLWGLLGSGAIAAEMTPVEQLLTTGEIQPTSEAAPVFNPLDTELSDAEPLDAQPSAADPLKTYFLSLESENPRRRVNLDAPATRVIVTSESGDTAVRCGDGLKTYSCIPGQSLEISRASDDPIAYIWAQNSGTNRIRLRIDVYE